MDGNGRMAGFLMNVMLAWTINAEYGSVGTPSRFLFAQRNRHHESDQEKNPRDQIENHRSHIFIPFYRIQIVLMFTNSRMP